MSINLPEWLVKERDQGKREVIVNVNGVSNPMIVSIYHSGFNKAAELLLNENRRVMKLNADLMEQIKLIAEVTKTRKGDWE